MSIPAGQPPTKPSKLRLPLRSLRHMLGPARVPDGLAIRKLRAGDLPAFFESEHLANGQKWLELQERNWMYVAVAEIHGAAVGRTCLMYNFMGDPPNAYSFASSVLPEWRSRGIGSALVAHTERVARSRGLFHITAHTATDNPRAAKWRERMGYRRLGEETIRWTEPDGRGVESLSWKFERTFRTPVRHRVRRWVRMRLPKWRKRLAALLSKPGQDSAAFPPRQAPALAMESSRESRPPA